jgi:hypothetical protein
MVCFDVSSDRLEPWDLHLMCFLSLVVVALDQVSSVIAETASRPQHCPLVIWGFPWEMFHVCGISKILCAPLKLMFSPHKSWITLSRGCLQGIWPYHILPGLLGLLWNLTGSFYDPTTLTFCMLVKPNSYGQCQCLLEAAAVTGLTWTGATVPFGCLGS